MEYLLIVLCQLLGIGFHVMQKIITIGNLHPEETKGGIISAFWKEDWDTLGVSALIIFTDLLLHYLIANYADSITSYPSFNGISYYALTSFGIAFILGYAGQRLIYKWLGSAEKFLDDKVSDRIK